MSVASDIANWLTEKIDDVSVAGGYATDAGLKVFRGRRRLDAVDLPCLVIIEGEDRVLGSVGRKPEVKLAQRYVIEGHSTCDPDNPNDTAHLLISDIKKAVFGGDISFGNVVRNMTYIGRTISAREDGLSVVAAAVEIEIEFVEQLTEP